MKKMMKRTLAFVLTLAMCCTFMPSAMAAEGDEAQAEAKPQFQISKSKTASPTVLDRDDPVTEVTLSMPSGEYKNKVDVVFVMDSSSSIKNAGYDFNDQVLNLLDGIIQGNPGIDLKIGVVKFTGFATDMIKYKDSLLSESERSNYEGLTLYDEKSKNTILAAIASYNDKKEGDGHFEVPGGGSNVQSGLIMADSLLSSDSEADVPDSNKYVILLTDGKSYMWNDKDNKPIQYYSQHYKSAAIQSSGLPVVTQVAGNNNKEAGDLYGKLPYDGENNYYYGKDTPYDSSKYYQWIYNKVDEELTSVETKYDFPAYYSQYYTLFEDYKGSLQPTGNDQESTPVNGESVFPNHSYYRTHHNYKPSENTVWAGENFHYLSVNPYNLTQDENKHTIFDVNNPDEDFFLLHPDTMQKGVYQAGHTWSDIKAKYYTAAITLPANKVGGGGGLHLPASFTIWLRENSNAGAVISDITSVERLFTDIDNSIRYVVGSGVVTDQITEPFDLVMDAYEDGDETKVPFRMVVGKDDEYIAEPVEGVENSWTFGEGIPEIDPETGNATVKYPYTVSWDGDKTFKWTINVPIENAKPVQLKYTLRWKKDKPYTGKYEPTNAKTTLEYKNSLGDEQTPEDFKSPEVLAPLKVFYDANSGSGTVVDDTNYEAGEITLKGSDGLSRSGYTFSGWSTSRDGEILPDAPFNLTEDTTFYAIWEQIPNPPTPPTPPVDIDDPDVPLDLNGADHFAYIEGYPDGTVQPGGNITRAEVSTMIYRLLTEDRRAEIFTDQNDYSDVEKPNWFNKAVSSMTEGKYVTGYPDGTFLPNQAITRAEFVTIVVRFLDGMKESENPFSDIDGHWAKDYILSAVDAGWIDGYPDGTFQPNKAITRAEAMKIMNTILHRGVNETSELGEPVMFPDNSDASQWYYYEVIEATNDHETEGERPDEQWKSNTIDYTYDIVKYERP